VKREMLAPEPWGTDIAVVLNGEELLVFGTRSGGEVTSSADLEQRGLVDELARFRAAERTRLAKNAISGYSLLMEFVNACTDEKLISFVRRYGPVSGYPPAEDLSGGYDHESGMFFEYRGARYRGNLVRIQNLDVIRIERRLAETIQSLSAAIWKASPEIRKLRELPQWSEVEEYSSASARKRDQAVADFQSWWKGFEPIGQGLLDQLSKLVGILADAASIPEYKRPLNEHWTRLSQPLSQSGWKGDHLNAHSLAVECLSRFFEEIRVRLELNDDVIEKIPVTDLDGILPVLHFMLQEHFLASRQVATCAKAGCGNTFLINRADARFCSESCAHASAQSKHWKNGGKQKRAERRALASKS